MDAQEILILGSFGVAGYAVAFAVATALVEALSEPWRRSVGAHWTARARLAYGPGHAVLCLSALVVPLTAAIGGVGPEILDRRLEGSMAGFWTVGMAAMAGVLTARYRWLRELWGARVTFRTWLAGCLLMVLAGLYPILIAGLVLFLLPDMPDRRSAVMFGVAVAAVGFFASGGNVRLLRWLGVVRPAPASVTTMVEELAQAMKVPGRVNVFELEWAPVNALAWVLYRAVGFTRPLLELLSPEEIRAVAAHELAHLIEPRWARGLRTIHLFAYLGLVPLIKYGGIVGSVAGLLMVFALLFAYKRLSHWLEQRADRLEREAIADAPVYACALSRIYEANQSPAVLPGTQSHPHLYDRLLAGGIQPAFARPPAPRRAKPLLAMAAAALLAFGLMFAMVAAAGIVLRFAQWCGFQ